ncbi:MAG: ribose-phosphate diphosphokinase [Candidatus Aenigmarchaeota archaeon]|nr:ribose-phosphate diphosphokinase [Candidatus Aenigmarchaeota archaeon]
MKTIIPTSHAFHLAKIMEKYDVNVVYPKIKTFPDGETYVRIPEEVRNQDVIVLCSDKNNPDKTLSELNGIAGGLKYSKAKSKKLFAAYMPYGRQDGKFKRGEPNRAKDILQNLRKHYEKIWIVDYHSNHKWVDKLAERISAFSLIKESIENQYRDVVYITPDEGAQKRIGIKGAKKKRYNARKVDMEFSKDLEELVNGKNVVIGDDLVSTGGTACRAYEEVKKLGARKVISAETHGVLMEGIKNIINTFDDYSLTDTINRKEANVYVHPLIAETIDVI